MSDGLRSGMRVIVPFGQKKKYTGMLLSTHNDQPAYDTKSIEQLIDDEPIVNDTQLDLWHWIADYYVCTLGEVMHAALPAAMRLSSETRIHLVLDLDGNFEALSDPEYHLVRALESGDLELAKINSITGQKGYGAVNRLLNKGIIQVREQFAKGYTPKEVPHLRFAEAFQDEDAISAALDELSRAPKQQAIVLAALDMQEDGEIEKRALLKRTGASTSILKSLCEKGILEQYGKETSRLKDPGEPSWQLEQLTPDQERADIEVQDAFKEHDTTLLHGVTSSGKSHIYMHRMAEMVQAGKQVLYLLPEIALTYQIVERLRQVFGNLLGVYHSRFSADERVEIWSKVKRGDYKIVVGARSALFLPYSDLGLVIVDEEHDQSLKQFDPAPRYQARDAAIYLAGLFGAKTLLGSGTPSLESYANAEQGKYGFVKMAKRYGDLPMPKIHVANVAEALRKKQMKTHLTPELFAALKRVLENDEQAILFQNRRGFAPYLMCHDCDWIPKCKNCDVSLTYHKMQHHLRCHYCGYKADPVHTCAKCNSDDVHVHGLGTEMVEEEIQLLFPDARIGRLDLDTARSRKATERLISEFENGNIQILVGTQMVTKGLDFDNVSLVGIISTDQLLNQPDFRAGERAFQLMEQVSGRAGRKHKQGEVILQAMHPQEPILQFVIDHDHESFFKAEMDHRRLFNYPPYSRLIHLSVRHREWEKADQVAAWVARSLEGNIEGKVMGPAIPPVSRIRNQYYRDVLLKIDRGGSALRRAKQVVRAVVDQVGMQDGWKGVRVHINVDP
jgi:primosomal protein N' (replication factor Y)